jgi:hypothetical protein
LEAGDRRSGGGRPAQQGAEREDRGQPAEHAEKLPALRPLVNLACLDTLDLKFQIGDFKAGKFFFSTNIVGAL